MSFLKCLNSKINDIKKQRGVKIIKQGTINQNQGQYLASPAWGPTGIVLKKLGTALSINLERWPSGPQISELLI